MKALRVHGGGDESARISDRVGGRWADKAVGGGEPTPVEGREAAMIVWSRNNSGKGDGDADFRVFKYVGEGPLVPVRPIIRSCGYRLELVERARVIEPRREEGPERSLDSAF